MKGLLTLGMLGAIAGGIIIVLAMQNHDAEPEELADDISQRLDALEQALVSTLDTSKN